MPAYTKSPSTTGFLWGVIVMGSRHGVHAASMSTFAKSLEGGKQVCVASMRPRTSKQGVSSGGSCTRKQWEGCGSLVQCVWEWFRP
ncbi:hypothetical protein EDC04DRAFT_145174 [Pisolithus marmoratus]|nr:hypothetical protein EDC04DRAFT_145174 [Pisolithus marmoratus]